MSRLQWHRLGDSLFQIITKAYIRLGYPRLLEKKGKKDGFVSIEIDPKFSNDTEKSIKEAINFMNTVGGDIASKLGMSGSD